MNRWLHYVTHHRLAVALVTALVAAAGLWSFINLQIDAIPDITGVQVQINTQVPALAPEEIERLVTLPIERAMGGQPGLDQTRSLTKTGLSQVTLLYKDGTDQLKARQLVTERLTAVQNQLPPGSTPQLAPITTGLGEIYYYTLEWRRPPPGMDAQRQLMELYEAQEYTVRPMLRAVPGVADVNSNGGLEEQFVVSPDPVRLRLYGVTAGELAAAVAKNVENAGGGIIRRGPERFTVRTDARVLNATQIGAIPVKFAAGVLPLQVRDLADVVIGAAPRQGAATQNGRETVLGTVMMLVGQNSRETALAVEDALPGIRAALPKGMVIDRQYSRADLVDRTVHTVEKNLGEGALLVALVLLLVMGNWRAALIVALVIPLAFLVTVSGMHAIGVSGNLMSLGALDFGLIVDGAIVVVENSLRLMAVRRQEKGGALTADDRRDVVAHAAQMVARPTFFGIAIIALVYVPVLSLGGVEGKLFQPMAQAVMLAIVAGLAWTFTIVPALSAWLLRSPRCRCAGRSPQGFRRHGGARLHARAEPGAGAPATARHRGGGAARCDLPRVQDAGIAVHAAARRRRDHRHGLSPGGHVAGREPGDRTADRGCDPPCLSAGHAYLLAHRHQRGGDRPDAAERERPVYLLRPPKGLADRRWHAAHEAGADRRHRKGRTPRLRRSEL